MSTDKLYVVIKRGLFWRPEDKGYTYRIEEAGRYTKDEALSRCHGGEQPVTMALATSFQAQESLQAEVDRLRLALAASQDEAEKAKADAARYQHIKSSTSMTLQGGTKRIYRFGIWVNDTDPEPFDAAIDAARADAARKEQNMSHDELNALCAENRVLREALTQTEIGRERLWQLLDDISTADDMFKENHAGFQNHAYKKAERRHEIGYSPDGHKLLWKSLTSVPQTENAKTAVMLRNLGPTEGTENSSVLPAP